MDKYELRQYCWIEKEIVQLEEEKRRILDQYLAPPAPDGMPHGSGTVDRLGNIVVRWDELQRKIDKKINALLALHDRIETAIEELPADDRVLVRMKYIDGLTWEQISVEMGFSWRHLHRRHGKILAKLSKMS